MKRMILTMMAAALVSMTALAQEEKQGQRPEPKFDKAEMVKHRTDETVKRYNLNSEQAKKLLELNNKYADKMWPRPPHRGHMGGPGRPPKDKGDGKCQCPKPQKDDQRPAPPKDEKRAENHKKMKETMEAYNAELQKIMTADQFKSYQEDMQKRREHHKRK